MTRHLRFGAWSTKTDRRHRQHYRSDGQEKKAWPADQVPRVLAELRAEGQGVEPYPCSVCGWWHFGNDYSRPKYWFPADEQDVAELGPRAHGCLRAENIGTVTGRRRKVEQRWRGVWKRAGIGAQPEGLTSARKAS